MITKRKKINWALIIFVFILGVLITSFVFLSISNYKQGKQINKLASEIEKLKADDIALAQIINNLIAQLQANRLIQPFNNQ
ncbi:MAG TPA: DUF1049 domain-containing protein [Candidatus Uhrbacteria bacterium]|nr:DUF1049 domain-containing protein [Candidatus Uhrbacteria bacterium]